MQIGGHYIGVTSGSTGGRDVAEMIPLVKKIGLEHVQLDFYPLLTADDKRKYRELGELRHSGLTVTAGVMGLPGEDYSTIQTIAATGGFLPDEMWPARWQIALLSAKFGAEIGVKSMSTHVGFVQPKDRSSYHVILQRVREVADMLHDYGCELLMETGQERAVNLLNFLGDLNRSNVAVNFDPANMILYGVGDPIKAIGIIGKHIKHVHVKDAVPSDAPRQTWGKEVPFGRGQVDPAAFIRALHEVGYKGPLVIEREGGPNRLGDIVGAVQALQTALAAVAA